MSGEATSSTSERPFGRRDFFRASVTGAAAMSLSGGLALADQPGDKVSGSAPVFVEPTWQLEVVDDCDVIVCGGGPAGFSAAIAAARTGARTRLFEVNGCLGGVWTSGLLTYVFDFDKPGLTCELTKMLDERDARVGDNVRRYVYHVEEMKCLLEEMTQAAGVKTQLHTRVVAAYKNDANRLTTIVTESKSGRQAWRASAFIDATGDGDLGALAGCEWDFGRTKDCSCQPMTLNALVTVPNVEVIKDYILFYDAVRHPVACVGCQGRGWPDDGGPVHQRRLSRPCQLPRYRELGGDGGSRRSGLRHRGARRPVASRS